MPICSVCGNQTGFLDLREGKCGACRTKEREADAATQKAEQRTAEAIAQVASAEAARLIITTEDSHNLAVADRLGIVAAERVFGLHILKDLFVGVRDIVGGRSATLEKAFQDAREQVIVGIREKAYSLGADAVVGVSITHSEIGGSTTQSAMILVVATGTAVRLNSQH